MSEFIGLQPFTFPMIQFKLWYFRLSYCITKQKTKNEEKYIFKVANKVVTLKKTSQLAYNKPDVM